MHMYGAAAGKAPNVNPMYMYVALRWPVVHMQY